MAYPKEQKDSKILLGHGSGGRLTHDLVRGLFLKKLHNPVLKNLTDSAMLKYQKGALAFTTDAFVVNPLFFPGADIGKLCICGTVNDLVMQAAVPEYIALSIIAEEGLSYKLLQRITDSIAKTCRESGPIIVTGDFKVVEKGSCDKIFITTSGIGRVLKGRSLGVKNIKNQDKIIITGYIAQHGLSVLTARRDLNLGFTIKSDCAALNNFLIPVLRKTDAIKFMRDPTRGGIATTLSEIAEASKLGIFIQEEKIPIMHKTRVACELLGLDPLYLANEGVAIIIAESKMEKKILDSLKKHPLGRNARVVGEVCSSPKARVVLKTSISGERVLDMLSSDPLPRIC